MRIKTLLFVIMILLIMAGTVYAQTYVVPQYTVIPVIMNQYLSSATAHVGDRFTATCTGYNCGRFPSGTMFLGVVTSVDRATRRNPGQIGVAFTQATFPNGATVRINGGVTSLDKNAVSVDPNTGFWVARPDTRSDHNKFIAYGAGAGLLIGALTDDVLKGGLIGAAAGWLFGRTRERDRYGRDVSIPAGTQFGVVLYEPVSVPARMGRGQYPYYSGRGRYYPSNPGQYYPQYPRQYYPSHPRY